MTFGAIAGRGGPDATPRPSLDGAPLASSAARDRQQNPSDSRRRVIPKVAEAPPDSTYGARHRGAAYFVRGRRVASVSLTRTPFAAARTILGERL